GDYLMPSIPSPAAGGVTDTKIILAKVSYDEGMNFSGKLNIPASDLPFQFVLGTPAEEPKTTSQAGSTDTSVVTVLPAITPVQSSTKWFPMNKKLGPVTMGQVGFAYNDGSIGLLLSGSVAMGPMGLSLNGLGLSFKVDELFAKKINPSFSLDGIGLSYDTPEVEIAGSFLRTTYTDAPDIFNGTAIIKASGISISAMGSYSKVGGQVSLFIYAYLEKALGGPSFFYVEGLAMGFGYNRTLVMPAIEQVATFPLVAQVMVKADPTKGKTPLLALNDELTLLAQYVPPTAGEMFLAIGVKFNTFKLIDSFALLAVSFGNRLEIDVLGQSNVVIPVPISDAELKKSPLAEIKILLLAKYIPDEGFLAVVARLSTDSYIFDKGCHLTGGAAFYSWFKGEHEGDFVVTMGGYHPSFAVPAHYPQVPRLALNWQINNNLSFKGDMYFALCSHAFMAGGHLEALYSSGDFKAWFRAGADFLVTWQPYHYEASIYLDIGASLHVDLWFTSFTITVNYGADLEIWGPEFSGKATVHIYVCDITIYFGASASTALAPIEWKDFEKAYLPDATKVLGMSLTNGVHNQEAKKDQPTEYISSVNPKEFELSINSLIPIKEITLNGIPLNANQLQTPNASAFGLAPMDKGNTPVNSTLDVNIKRSDTEGGTYRQLGSADFDNLVFEITSKNFPASIWGKELKPTLNDKNRLILADNGVRIHAVEPTKLPKGGVGFPEDVITAGVTITISTVPFLKLDFHADMSTFSCLNLKTRKEAIKI
ncbi:MAG TPA: DUF6603 domain-containing protein, partial [Flavobacterium sp.]